MSLVQMRRYKNELVSLRRIDVNGQRFVPAREVPAKVIRMGMIGKCILNDCWVISGNE